MKLKNIKIRFPKKIGGKKIYYGIVMAVIVGQIAVTIYLVNNIVETFKATEKIISLRQEIASEIFNIQDFDDALDKINKKIDQLKNFDWAKAKNIFSEKLDGSGAIYPIKDVLKEVKPR